MTTTHVGVPGGDLRVVDAGEGPPVVLLHAGVADLRAWDGVAPLLVEAGYRVVRYDSRGFGASTTEDVDFSTSADLIAVLDALGIRRAALVGNSLGGRTAFDTAIESPDRVVAVIGVAAGLDGYDGGSTAEEALVYEAYKRVDAAEPYDPEALTDFEVGVWLDGPGQAAGRVIPAVREAMRAMARPLNEPDRVRGRETRPDLPANDRLDELACPVLAIAGALDFSEVAQTAKHLEAAAPNARALVWPDVAHMIGMEQPVRLAGEIRSFLDRLDRWT